MVDIYIEDMKTAIGNWITLPLFEDELEAELDDIFEKGNNCNADYSDIKVKRWNWDDEVNEVFNIIPNQDIYDINEIITQIEEHSNPHKYEILKYLQEEKRHRIEDAIENINQVDFYEKITMRSIAEDYIKDNHFLDKCPDIIAQSIDYNEVAERLNEFNEYYIDGPNIFHYIECA